MSRGFALITFFAIIIAVTASIIEEKATSSENQETFAISSDLIQEGQSSDLIIRAKRYYGCGCGCGCATVAAVSAAPCGYGCCGCGYGK